MSPAPRTEDTLLQQTTAEHLERQLGWESLYTCNNEDLNHHCKKHNYETAFVSSVQKELQADRYAVCDFVHGNELLSQFFRVFLFEELQPTGRRPDDVYLDEVASFHYVSEYHARQKPDNPSLRGKSCYPWNIKWLINGSKGPCCQISQIYCVG